MHRPCCTKFFTSTILSGQRMATQSSGIKPSSSQPFCVIMIAAFQNARPSPSRSLKNWQLGTGNCSQNTGYRYLGLEDYLLIPLPHPVCHPDRSRASRRSGGTWVFVDYQIAAADSRLQKPCSGRLLTYPPPPLALRFSHFINFTHLLAVARIRIAPSSWRRRS